MRRTKLNKALKLSVLIVAVIVCVCILLHNLSENIMFFLTPTEALSKNHNTHGKIFKIGGLVKEGSILSKYQNGKLCTKFVLTDQKADLSVVYTGAIPMIFKEKQGAVVVGSFSNDPNIFIANTILVKHDENYAPPQP